MFQSLGILVWSRVGTIRLKIAYDELHVILDDLVDLERLAWVRHFQRVLYK